MKTYLALLRGINVGGKHIIKMNALKEAFKEMGFKDPTTYIQSGNVIFEAKASTDSLTAKVEKALSKKFNYNSSVVIVPQTQFKTIVEQAPRAFGKKPDKFRYDVIFLKKGLSPSAATKAFNPKEGVDELFQGKYVVYFSRLIAKASQSRMSRIVKAPEYQRMTIRNWNTTQKLYTLINDS